MSEGLCSQCDAPATNGRWCEAHAQIVAMVQDHYSGRRKVDPGAIFSVDLRENAFLAAIARGKTFAYPGTETRTITSAEDACTFETRLVSAKTFEDVPVVAQRVVNIQAGEKKGTTT